MKKTFILVLLVVTLVGTVASAKQSDIGIGVEYVFTYGSLGALNGFAITGSPPVLPLVFGLNLSFATSYFNLGITGDWWLWQTGIAGPLALYAGPGLFLGVNLSGSAAFSFGARGVIALQIFPIQPLEFFLETGVNVGLAVGSGGAGLTWGIPVSLGGRFWF